VQNFLLKTIRASTGVGGAKGKGGSKQEEPVAAAAVNAVYTKRNRQSGCLCASGISRCFACLQWIYGCGASEMFVCRLTVFML